MAIKMIHIPVPGYADATLPELSVAWIHKVFGPLQFEDKSTCKMGKYLAELGITMPGGLNNA